jgi:AcrR family transcriptional regulator
MTQPTSTPDVDTSAAPDTTKLGRKRDHTRDSQILEAAIEVLGETGYEGMTIDMVAARAKAGKATLYRRWASKEELVIDAVASMKRSSLEAEGVPDTGTLRGDLVAMIKTPAIEAGERNFQVMAGVMTMLAKHPDLADTAYAAIMEPRTVINRLILQRAIHRGEISAETDVESLAVVTQAMASFRVLVLRKPITREFFLSIVDGIIMPAVRPVPAALDHR